ncbi:MAG TPA: DMT family transporter [Patescibacteria group bacterium]|nr:DMT family transporter [Patescibacteria group bacterium]
MKLSTRHLALLALTGSYLIWGATPPIFKWSMEEIPPYTLGFLRFMLASLIILPFAYKKIAIKKDDFTKLLTLAAVGITLSIALFLVGLQLTSSINTPIIQALTPLLMIIGSVWYLHEKLQKRIVIGGAISVIGILLIVLQPILMTGPDGSIPGNLLILLSVFCAVVYTLLLKKYNLPYPTVTIVFWTFLFGGLLFLPAFLTELVLFQPFAHFDMKALIGVGFGAIFASAIAFFLYAYSLKYLTASEVSIFIYIEPIITILVAIPLLHETLHPIYIVGSLIVFLGIFVAEVHRNPHHHRHLKHKHLHHHP